jgi:hypothetical protein
MSCLNRARSEMPTIIVLPDTEPEDASAFKFKERVRSMQLHDAHFRAQLIERLEWAVEDAEQDESNGHQPGTRRAHL